MPNPPLSKAIAEETVKRVEAKLREGYRPPGVHGMGAAAIKTAALQAVTEGFASSVNTFISRLEPAKVLHGYEPDWSAYRPRQYLHTAPGEPLIPPQDHIREDAPEGEPVTVCVIGDAHDSPHIRDKSRFEWLGAFASEHGVDRVVQIGDWWTMDCFSTHTDRATFEGRAKPTFEQDRDSFHQSQRAFHKGMAGHKAKLDVTLGNHEVRAWRWDNLHPEAEPHGLKVQEAFAQWGWRTTPYGEYRFIEGVGFVHIPFNAMGKPLAQSQRVNRAMFDTVHGDDHRATQLTDYKAGPFRSPTIYSAGTALPPGFIEGFAGRTGSTWRAGVCLATLWGGYVRSWQFTEMLLLERRYGKRAA